MYLITFLPKSYRINVLIVFTILFVVPPSPKKFGKTNRISDQHFFKTLAWSIKTVPHSLYCTELYRTLCTLQNCTITLIHGPWN